MNSKRGKHFTISGHVWFAMGAAALTLTLGGCSAKNPQIESDRSAVASTQMSPEACEANAKIESSAAQDPGYRIQPGDQLALDFYMNPEFNDTVTVNPDGKAALRMVG